MRRYSRNSVDLTVATAAQPHEVCRINAKRPQCLDSHWNETAVLFVYSDHFIQGTIFDARIHSLRTYIL